MCIDIEQFRMDVVRPILNSLALWSAAAEELVIGTAAHESHLKYLRQTGSGPALGICQMEPATHDDIWENFLAYKPDIAARMRSLFGLAAGDARHLTWNLGYAAAMCRIHYYRRPEALPNANDLPGLAAYWKAHYNTELGAGTVTKWMFDYNRIVKGGA